MVFLNFWLADDDDFTSDDITLGLDNQSIYREKNVMPANKIQAYVLRVPSNEHFIFPYTLSTPYHCLFHEFAFCLYLFFASAQWHSTQK